MRIALVGTRGVPARYGGFETAVEEIGQRLAARGHEVVVYCRGALDTRRRTYLGMELVHLPAARRKSLETLSHTALSVLHLVPRRRFDAVIVFNAANAPFLPLLRLRRLPTAVHVDGLEWKRSKWRGAGQHYYRVMESLSVRWADALIADAAGIADYYVSEFSVPTELIAYGAPVQEAPGAQRIAEFGLLPKRYHIAVARFEPENHVLEIVQGYAASQAALPLVVVGGAPYSNAYTRRVQQVADTHPGIRLLGGIWDSDQLDELYANALTYLHGHSVGGTNPSLLRAMGAGTAVLAYDVIFNRDVLDSGGDFFENPDDIAGLLVKAEENVDETLRWGLALRERARRHYRWDDVALGYEALVAGLRDGRSTRGAATGRRSGRGGSRSG